MATTVLDADYDKKIEVKAFDDTKAGVKGIMDSGITKLPRIFIHGKKEHIEKSSKIKKFEYHIPVVDLQFHECANHQMLVNQIRHACQSWGFFQVVNHGIPLSIMDDMLERVRMFHEQDEEIKRPFYSRDSSRTAVYHSNIDLYYSKAAIWKDTVTFRTVPPPPDPKEIPVICRCGSALCIGFY